MATQTGSIDLKVAKQAATAAQTASKYISEITDAGIFVHLDGMVDGEDIDANDAYGVHISDDVDIIRGGEVVASYGATTTIGSEYESHVEQNATSWKMVDANYGEYASIEDIIGPSGETRIEEVFIASNDQTETFTLFFSNPTNITALIDGERNGSVVNNGDGTVTVTDSSSTMGGTIVAISYTTDSRFIKAFTFGYRSGLKGIMSFSEGISEASGLLSHSEGQSTRSIGIASHSEGNGSVAGGDFSHAQNLGTVANGFAQTAIGTYNIIDNEDEYAFIIGRGDGSIIGHRANALAVDWNGDIHILEPNSGDLYSAIDDLGWTSEVIV